MFFKRKDEINCEKCKSKITHDFSYCPYCGEPMLDSEKDRRNFGLIGRNDALDEREMSNNFMEANLGITDKIIDSIFSSVMKSVEKQIREGASNIRPGVKSLPNGIKIKIGPAMPIKHTPKKQTAERKQISEQTLQRLVSMPKGIAKSQVRRFSDKIVYELDVPGINSPDDVLFTKLESGYEVKAIGKTKVYVNSLPLELPLKGFIIEKNKLFVEFAHQQPQE
jgi:hypothetical protein